MIKVLTFSMVVLMWGAYAQAEDVIYLKNGEVLQGQVLAQDTTNEMIQFRFQDGREFLIRTVDIQNMISQYNPMGQQPQNYAQQPPQNYSQQPYFAPQPNYSPNPYMPAGRQGRGMSSIGQTREKSEGKSDFWDTVRLGIKAGINSANVKTSDKSKTSSLTGGSVAAVAEIPVYQRVSFQGEIGFSQYGYSGVLSDNEIKLNYDVVEAQLLGKLKLFHRNNKLNIALLGGVAPGYRVSSKVSSGDLGLDANTFTKAFSASGVVGGTFSWRLGKKTELGIDVRYLIGLTDLSSQDVTSKNVTTFFGASLIF